MSSNTSLAIPSLTPQAECRHPTIVMEVMISLSIPSAVIPALSVFVNSMALYRILKYKVYEKRTTSTLVVLVISDLSVAFLEILIRYLISTYPAECLDIMCNRSWLLRLPFGVINQIPMHCLVVHLGIRYQLFKKITDNERNMLQPSLGWRRIVAGTLFFCIILNTVSFVIATWLITGFDLVYATTIMVVSLYLNAILNRVVRRNRIALLSQSLRRRFNKQAVYGNICLSISVLVFFFRNLLFILGMRLRWKLPLQVAAFIMNIPSLNNGLTYIIMDSAIRGFTISCRCFSTNQVEQS